jgi:hypothetical protein
MYKNKLQEYCQKNSLNLPRYKTKRLDSPDHFPSFRSFVFVKLDKYSKEPTKSTSGPKKTKKGAEMDAAEKFIEENLPEIINSSLLLPSKRLPEKATIETHQKYVIFFDVENLLQEFSQFVEMYHFDENVEVTGFISEKHHMYEKMVEKCESTEVKLKSIDLLMKDAVDFYVCVELGKIMNDEKYDDFYAIVMTKDKFGQIVEEVCKHTDKKYISSVKSFSSLNGMMRYIRDP